MSDIIFRDMIIVVSKEVAVVFIFSAKWIWSKKTNLQNTSFKDAHFQQNWDKNHGAEDPHYRRNYDVRSKTNSELQERENMVYISIFICYILSLIELLIGTNICYCLKYWTTWHASNYLRLFYRFCPKWQLE